MDEKAYKMALLGLTIEEMAGVFGVAKRTVLIWAEKHSSFAKALKRGGAEADAQVAASLFKRATGFTKEQVKIFNANGTPLIVPYLEYYPPDPKAAHVWLRNRQRDLWTDTVVTVNEHNHKGKITHDHRAVQAAEAFLGRILDHESGSVEEDAEVAGEERPLLLVEVSAEQE